MTEIEDLVARFNSLPLCQSGRWSVDPLHGDRAYLTRDELGAFTVFLKGDRASFGTYPKVRGVQHVDGIVPVPGGVPFSALKLTSPSPEHGNRAIAHVAYEVERRLASESPPSNANLVAEVGWILDLLTATDPVMPPEQQKGLIGELLLLRKLVTAALEAGIPPVEALRRWWGWDRAKRDFASEGLAIEVKTTSLSSRRHYVGSLDQLETHGDEKVYVFSLGARLDPTAPRKLPDVVHELRALLQGDQTAEAMFDDAVRHYGYDRDLENQYRALPGLLNFHLPPHFFDVESLDRLRLTSFKKDTLPSMVSEVMYVLDITAPELSPDEERSLLASILARPALVG